MNAYRGLAKIISGGQIGVDQGALHAAFDRGLVTGGWAPAGWRTERGPNPLLAAFGLKEHQKENYQARTAANVKSADATLIIAINVSSAGTKLTIQEAELQKKPCLVLNLKEHSVNSLIPLAVDFIRTFKVRTLNVAGNREQAVGVTTMHETSRLLLDEILDELESLNLLIRDTDF